MAQSHKVEGFVFESGTRKPISEANVFSGSFRTITNENGYFFFSIREGTQDILISHIGFDTLRQIVQIKSDTLFNFYITKREGVLEEVTVTAGKSALEETSPGIVRLSKKELKSMPAFMGQHDPLKALQKIPGIGNSGEGNSGLFVRGGTSGQNLVMLNQAVIYNPSHFLGFFSVFNPDAIEQMQLYKSGMPVEYGGRLSSVLAVESGRNIQDSLHMSGNISPLSGNLHLSLPLTKNWSAAVSARKTFMNHTIWPLLEKMNLSSNFFKKINYDFYDFNLTSNAQLGKNDRLAFSFYSGKDDFGFSIGDFGIGNTMDWSNKAASVSWNKLISNKISMEHSLIRSAYKFNFGLVQEKLDAGIASEIKDHGYKGSLNFYAGRHKLKLGLEFIDHQFIPNTPAVRSAGVDMDYGSPNIYSAGELAFYLGDEFKFNSRLTLYGGLRFTRYKPKKQLAGTQDENVQVNHAEEAVIYQYAEPRLTLHYQLSEDEVFKASLSRNIQPVHMISVTAVNFPSDFWMPSVKGLPPARGMQFSAGYYRNFSSRKYESYIDFYYKKMDKLVEFSGGLMNLIDNLEIEDYLFSGGGNAYGSEISVKKNAGRLTGWMGYTLSWSNRSFPEINDGKRFPAKYDRRHDLSLTAIYHCSPKLSLSASFVYASGHAYTRPVSRYVISGSVVNEYGPFNGARMPAYHRADIGADYILSQTNKAKSTLTFSVYNLYSRQNPIYTFFMAEGSLEEHKVSIYPKSVSLLPILPCISWSYYIK